MIDYELMWSSLPALLQGACVTIEITVFASCIGYVLGIFFGLLEESDNFFVKSFLRIYVSIIRGTPMLIQILFIFFVLPQIGIKINATFSAIVAIGLNSSAYVSQIIRSGILAIGPGQIEAAKTLGLTKVQTMLHIVLPQAIKNSFFALGNELVTLIKDSSLASIIGVMELTKEGSVIRSRTYDAFSVLLMVALIYLVLTSSVTFFLELYAKRMKTQCSK